MNIPLKEFLEQPATIGEAIAISIIVAMLLILFAGTGIELNLKDWVDRNFRKK